MFFWVRYRSGCLKYCRLIFRLELNSIICYLPQDLYHSNEVIAEPTSYTFLARVQDQDLIYYYAAIDVCLVPNYYEPLGSGAIEAIASNTPLASTPLASRVGGLKYTVVDRVTELLAHSQQESAFSRAIAQILSNPIW